MASSRQGYGVRAYRRLLRLAAPSLSRDYGDAMEETLAVRLGDAGGWPRIRVWVREFAMLIALAWSERFGARERAVRRRRSLLTATKAGLMDSFGQELRQAARRLLRAPAFTAATVLTLALAIGANAAIFAVVQRVVISPLPYPQSDRLLDIEHGSLALKLPAGIRTSAGIYFMYRERARTLESVAIYASGDRTLAGTGDPERVRVTTATPSLSGVLRTTTSLGRWFSDDEGLPGGRPVAVISDGLWRRRFDGADAVIGRSLVLDGRAFEVVGVMPASFAFPDPRVDVWLPEPLSAARGFGIFTHQGVARLKDGASFDDARAELGGMLADIATAYPGDPVAIANLNTKLTFAGRPLKDAVLGNVTRALWILLAAVGGVLLIACANVANLFLVRSELRQREIAIRRALGAGQFGLGRFFMTESLMLSVAGGLFGLGIAWSALKLLVRYGPALLPRRHEIALDPITMGTVTIVCVLVTITFGVVPLLGRRASATLHDSGRGNTTSPRRHFARHTLLGAQVALALVLLVATSLMVRSAINLRAIDPGFNPESTLTFSVGLPESRYGSVARAVTMHHQMLDRLSALPGVTAAAGTTCLPLSGGCTGNTIVVEGDAYPPGTLPPLAVFRAVTGGYFEALGMRVLKGRSITRADVDTQAPVGVISSTLARSAFGNRDPIGGRIASHQPPGRNGAAAPRLWLEVVGIVGDVPSEALNESTRAGVLYMPLSLARDADTPLTVRVAPSATLLSYVVRTVQSPTAIVPAARQAIMAVDNTVALAHVITLQGLIDRSSAQMTFTMTLLAVAAAGALVLGSIGIYGVTSYIVSQRTSEIGVRLALGAEPAGITVQIVRQIRMVALIGAAIGLGGAFAGSRLIEAVLFGVSPRDPVIFATVAIALVSVALLACWIPARRAARLSPTIALRAD